jgi:hypothetical protein
MVDAAAFSLQRLSIHFAQAIKPGLREGALPHASFSLSNCDFILLLF